VPFYYEVSSLCHNLHVTSPKVVTFRSALLNGGYKVSQTHCSPNGVSSRLICYLRLAPSHQPTSLLRLQVKTDAPNHVVFDILRAHAAKNPPKEGLVSCCVLLVGQARSSAFSFPIRTGALAPSAPGTTILKKQPEFKADFTEVKGAKMNQGLPLQQDGSACFVPQMPKLQFPSSCRIQRSTGARKRVRAAAPAKAKTLLLLRVRVLALAPSLRARSASAARTRSPRTAKRRMVRRRRRTTAGTWAVS
jgi:hypothetical protein